MPMVISPKKKNHQSIGSESRLGVLSLLRVYPARLEDSRDIWAWRNDETTRMMSINNEEITWEAHCHWFERILQASDIWTYIALDGYANKVGVCRFDLDPSGNFASVSINLNPLLRGQGRGTEVVRTGVSTFWADYRTVPIRALIKKDNHASLRCFLKAGFQREPNDEGDIQIFIKTPFDAQPTN